MSFLDYVLNGLGLHEIEQPKVKTKEKKTQAEFLQTPKKKAIPISQKCDNVAIFTPEKLSDITSIVEFLATNQQALLDLNYIDFSLLQRVADYIGGAVLALGGKVENLGGNLFLLVSRNTKILRN
ncbi:MAG: cell division protein SepF [Clostridia bacterium]|nr:cell division protein SepF [Clostridia bacterium]